VRSVLRDRPELDRARLAARNAAMNRALPDACISGYEDLPESIRLSDVGDRHVLAAAIHAKADIIVTYNLRDFPASVLDRYEMEARHPDAFLRHLIDLNPVMVTKIARDIMAALTRPALGMGEFLANLEKLALPETAAVLRELLAEN
jgi:hypothetical protein